MLIKVQRFLFACLALPLAVLGSNSQANETYQFDPSHSRISFTVHQFLGTTVGKFTRFEGKIDIDRNHPEQSSVIARIDVGSVNTGIARRDDHLRSADFFNVTKYPEIRFKSRSVMRTAEKSGDIFGDLTMHGVTKPITLHVRLISPISAEASRTRWAVATEPLKRRDFGLSFGEATEAVSGISQTVAINIEIEATRTQ
jgi:polyisoprenoid-binding protein YceI